MIVTNIIDKELYINNYEDRNNWKKLVQNRDPKKITYFQK